MARSRPQRSRRAGTRSAWRVDTAVARRAASLHVPDPAPVADALIAATALSHEMVIVTRNVGDFRRFEELRILNPWNQR